MIMSFSCQWVRVNNNVKSLLAFLYQRQVKKAARGSILVLVVIYLFVLMYLGFAVVYIFAQEQIFSDLDLVNTRTFYLAYSGIQVSKGWLSAQTLFPENISVAYRNTFIPGGLAIGGVNFNGSGDDGTTGSTAFAITPSSGNNVNLIDPTQSVCGLYTINSTGKVQGGIYTTTQNLSLIVLITTTTVPGVPGHFEIKPNSWVENPVQRN